MSLASNLIQHLGRYGSIITSRLIRRVTRQPERRNTSVEMVVSYSILNCGHFPWVPCFFLRRSIHYSLPHLHNFICHFFDSNGASCQCHCIHIKYLHSPSNRSDLAKQSKIPSTTITTPHRHHDGQIHRERYPALCTLCTVHEASLIDTSEYDILDSFRSHPGIDVCKFDTASQVSCPFLDSAISQW